MNELRQNLIPAMKETKCPVYPLSERGFEGTKVTHPLFSNFLLPTLLAFILMIFPCLGITVAKLGIA